MSRLFALEMAFALVLAASAHAAEDPFAIQVIPSSGRTVTAELADLDGDGREDLLHAVVYDMPPVERRVLRVHLQRSDGSFDERPDLEAPVAGRAAAYDIADIDSEPGAEVLLLQQAGVDVIGFKRDPGGTLQMSRREVAVPADTTIGAAVDERGLDRLRIASFEFGPEPWLIVPGLSETFFLAPNGELRARIDSGVRANYFVQPPGPLLTESDIQLYLDAPRISVGDIDGDGRPDILASGRHELRLFFQREDGSYPRRASKTIALKRVSFEDHMRGSGSVRSSASDIDGDGLADLLLSLTVGGIMNAHSNTYVHMNRGSGWDLEHPDAAFEAEKTLSADQLIDLDGDGRLEIIRTGIPISLLELVEIFLQSAIDVRMTAYRIEHAPTPPAEPPASPSPLLQLKFGVPLDLEATRTAGFMPRIGFDMNGDGFGDFLNAPAADRLEVYLGSAEKGFEKVSSQKLPTQGQIHAGDLDADGLADFVLFNTRRLDAPVRLLRNRGVLPGTQVRPTLVPAPE